MLAARYAVLNSRVRPRVDVDDVHAVQSLQVQLMLSYLTWLSVAGVWLPIMGLAAWAGISWIVGALAPDAGWGIVVIGMALAFGLSHALAVSSLIGAGLLLTRRAPVQPSHCSVLLLAVWYRHSYCHVSISTSPRRVVCNPCAAFDDCFGSAAALRDSPRFSALADLLCCGERTPLATNSHSKHTS